jgi:hypothetical protein
MFRLATRWRAIALGVLCVALCAVAFAYASAFFVAGGARWSVPAFIVGVCLAMGALMALGAGRAGEAGLLWLPILLTVSTVAAALLLAWALTGEGEPLWLGLPRRAAIVLYGAGLLPMFVLPSVYALTFDRWTLRSGDVERVRAARDAMLGHDSQPDESGRV